MMRRNLLILAGLVVFILYSGVALAEAPSNDNMANALDVTRLPFTHTVDTTEATQESDELNCGTVPGGKTVWFKITTRNEMRIGFHTVTKAEDLSLSIFTGSPGSSLMLYCSYSYYNALEATAGTTYYIQLATCCGTAGGPVTMTIQEIPALTVDVRIERHGQIDGAGVARVSGRVRCNRFTPPGSGHTIQGTLNQGNAKGWLVPVHFGDGCSPRWRDWSAEVQLLSGSSFTDGAASLEATAFACDEFDICANADTKVGKIKLR